MADASFPAYHVTGPVHHYYRKPGGAVVYLGTAETQPRMSVTHVRRPIINDVAGPDVPAQKKDGGRVAAVSVLFNRFSHWAVADLKPPGQQGRFNRGQLIYGVKSFQVWQVFENYLDAATRAMYPDLPIGYYWPQVDWAADEDTPGNIDQKVLFQWEASEQWTGLPTGVGTANGNVVAAGAREWLLFSQADDAYFPASVRVPQ